MNDRYISNTRYGHNKAKRIAQEEANRTGRRTYMQLDWLPSGKAYVLTSQGYIPFMNAPFWTFYPQKKSK